MSMIQFHILRNYSPSNLNRDEIGAPKTAVFAGVQRGRISSQCLKRAWRESDAFKSLGSSGVRTKFLPELVVEKVKELAGDDVYRFAQKNKNLFSDLGKSEKTVANEKEKQDEKDTEYLSTKQLMFFSDEDIIACAEAVINAENSVKNLKDEIGMLKKQAKIRPITLDIALFGRMVTDDKFADVEASLQVAHALSTNRVNQESDYFTAVDDLGKVYTDDLGAGHLGDCDFNSCCYYIYASLDIDQLKRNLNNSPDVLEKLPSMIDAVIDAMIYTSPTGKQNSFAAHSLPSIICLEKKSKKIPVSYVNAFEDPITYNYSAESAKRLVSNIDNTDNKFDTAIESRIWFDINDGTAPQRATIATSIQEIKDLTSDWLL